MQFARRAPNSGAEEASAVGILREIKKQLALRAQPHAKIVTKAKQTTGGILAANKGNFLFFLFISYSAVALPEYHDLLL